MKKKQLALVFSLMTVMGAASCARKEPEAVVEKQTSALQPAPEPVPESAWRPAPIRTNVSKQKQVPAKPPVEMAANAPVAVPQSEPTKAIPAPTEVYTKPARTSPPAPTRVTLPEGSTIAARVSDTLSSETSEIGDAWSGVLAESVVINGLVIAERGAAVEGRVTDAKRAGRVKGVAQVSVALTRFNTADGQRINVQTASFARAGKDETKRDVGKVAIASGIGAAIGAIAGRGKGAAIGAGAGAAAGTGAVLATRGGPAEIATETLIRFRVSEPVTITEKLK